MTAETKALLEKIVCHQLEGVMFHVKYACMVKKLGDKRMACFQRKQALEEMDNHLKTVLHLIEHTGEMFEGKNDTANAKGSLELLEKTSGDTTKTKICCDMLGKWQEWEFDTVKLYSEAVNAMPNCRMWKCLKHEAEKELGYVSYLFRNKTVTKEM